MAEEKREPLVEVPPEFKYFRKRTFHGNILNEAYEAYKEAVEKWNEFNVELRRRAVRQIKLSEGEENARLQKEQFEAQALAMKTQMEGEALRTTCLAIVAEATIDSRDVLYAVVNELRKINSRYEKVYGDAGAWRHPLDHVSGSFAVHELSGQWPAPLCPDCGKIMEIETWSEEGVPESWCCDTTGPDHEDVGLSESDVQRCRVCRCIDDFGCSRSVVNGDVEICHWVEPGLCSACVEEEESRCDSLVRGIGNDDGRAILCGDQEVVLGHKECDSYDDTGGECMKAIGLKLKEKHQDLHEQIQEELDKVDEKNSDEEKVVQPVLTVEHGQVDEKDSAEEKVVHSPNHVSISKGLGLVNDPDTGLWPAPTCPYCQSFMSGEFKEGVPVSWSCTCERIEDTMPEADIGRCRVCRCIDRVVKDPRDWAEETLCSECAKLPPTEGPCPTCGGKLVYTESEYTPLPDGTPREGLYVCNAECCERNWKPAELKKALGVMALREKGGDN